MLLGSPSGKGAAIAEIMISSAGVVGLSAGPLAADRHRLAEIDALIGDSEYRPGDPGWEISQALASAAVKDTDCLRGFAGVTMVLSRAADVK